MPGARHENDRKRFVRSEARMFSQGELWLDKTAYRRFLGCEVSHLSKLWRFFCEPKFRRRQAYPEFPDQALARLFLACVRTMRQSAIERLVEHVHERMGGFHVDRWKLRTPAIPRIARRGVH